MVPRPRNGLSLCGGAGGLDLGVMLAEPGFHTRAWVEIEPHARDAIIAGQRAGYFAPAPIWDDVKTFDGRPYRGAIDTVLAGYPCQPFSAAGQRRGTDDPRHLWPDVARIILEIDPEWVFLENVAGHITLGAEAVLRELRDMGWTPAAGAFSAAEVGAPHERLRWFCVAFRSDGEASSGGGLANSYRNHDGERAFDGGEKRGVQSRERANNCPDVSDRCGDELARDDGGHPRSEREQRGGQQRLLPAGGGTGAGDVADTGRSERRSRAETGDIGHGEATGRQQGAGGPQQPSGDVADTTRHDRRIHTGRGPEGRGTANAGGRGDHVDHAASPRRDDARGGAEADGQGRECLPGTGRDHMADASGAERQGQQRGQHHPRGRQVKDGHPALPGRTGLFPPGPGDIAAWAGTISVAPDLAPAVAFGDIARRAQQLGEMVARGELAEAQAESAFRGMVDGLAQRSRALRLLGNGVCPLAAGHAWRSLGAAHGLRPLDMETANHGDAEGDAA